MSVLPANFAVGPAPGVAIVNPVGPDAWRDPDGQRDFRARVEHAAMPRSGAGAVQYGRS